MYSLRHLHGIRAAIWTLVLLLCALAWIRSHFRADRIQWFTENKTDWQFVSARGRLYFRHETLGYSLPELTHLTEVIRDGPSCDYRLVATTLGRSIDHRFAGFELARGADNRLSYWGYRMTYGPAGPMPFWSVQIPDWFVMLLAAAPASAAILNFSKRMARLRRGRCVECGYDIRVSTDRCPECGAAIGPPKSDSVAVAQ